MDTQAIIKKYTQMGTSVPIAKGSLPDKSDIIDSVVDEDNHLWWVTRNNGTVSVIDAENSYPSFPPSPRRGVLVTLKNGTA